MTTPSRTGSAARTAVSRLTMMAVAGWLSPPGQPPADIRCLATAKPVARWPMPERFHEVSGLAVSADGRVWVHHDEAAEIGALDPARGNVVARYSMGSPAAKGDFEGIAVGRGRIYLTTSDGVLYDAPLPPVGSEGPLVATVTDTRLGEQCEIEGLAYDPASDVLVFACKTPRKKKLRGHLTIHRWSVATNQPAEPRRIEIPLPPGLSFRSSALEVDPAGGTYLLLSSADRAFMGVDRVGRIVATGRIPGRHRQPEGLAIGPDGRLYVGDEGGRTPGTVTVYTCR